MFAWGDSEGRGRASPGSSVADDTIKDRRRIQNEGGRRDLFCRASRKEWLSFAIDSAEWTLFAEVVPKGFLIFFFVHVPRALSNMTATTRRSMAEVQLA